MIEDIFVSAEHTSAGNTLWAIARLEPARLDRTAPTEERRQPYRIICRGLRVLRANYYLATVHQG